MPLLNDKIQADVRKMLDNMAGPVKMVMFTQSADALECEMCAETRMLVEEIAALSDKITAEFHDFVTEKTLADEYQVDKIPAIALVGAQDYGIRYYGIPSGYEFSSLIDDLVTVSKGESGLADATKTAVARLNSPVHIQVFVTPT